MLNIKKDNIYKRIKLHKEFFDSNSKQILNSLKAPKVLKNVMLYSILNGGKRIRPFILSEVAKLYGVKKNVYKYPSYAIEMAHGFSLIYDDLPCMDNDVLRRGKPTVHIAFSEANALLGGASLLILAYKILSSNNFKANKNLKNKIIENFSDAIGSEGMLAGQFLDLEAESPLFKLTLQKFKIIQQKKTSLLIAFSSLTGAMLGGASQKEQKIFLEYGLILGKIFQITDDILDVEGNEKVMGKKINKDKKLNKATLIRLKGIIYAKKEVERLVSLAKNELKKIRKDTKILEEFADFLSTRVQ